ncbi:MAG TPA: phosphatidate cytidylyltransferase [Xanthobacteraceae bacterium]|nr:phosphatidate cytidylyltransferase [Xanthobacteraceae bacterium]
MSDPAAPAPRPSLFSRELLLRVASALVMAPLAVAVAYYGDWPFAIFWGLAGIIILREWTELVAPGERRSILAIGILAIILGAGLADSGRFVGGVLVVLIGPLAGAVFAPAGRRGWMITGMAYAGALVIATIILRSDANYGLAAIILLFAVVWATDIAAYFAGRLIGGPKVLPAVSPKKTWSGAIGGLLAAVGAAAAVVYFFALPDPRGVLAMAVLLSVVSQAGDFFESALKRRFNVKDASQLIPGHGGLLDRLDGFVPAVIVAALIGLLRSHFEAPGAGLVVW